MARKAKASSKPNTPPAQPPAGDDQKKRPRKPKTEFQLLTLFTVSDGMKVMAAVEDEQIAAAIKAELGSTGNEAAQDYEIERRRGIAITQTVYGQGRGSKPAVSRNIFLLDKEASAPLNRTDIEDHVQTRLEALATLTPIQRLALGYGQDHPLVHAAEARSKK